MADEFCKKVDLNLTININLLADAPQGHPHLLNVKRPQKNPIAPKIEKHKSRRIEFPEGLSLVDVLVTILFDWKPAALHHLLNVEDEQFYCAAKLERTLRYESWDRFIVNRLGHELNDVELEPNTGSSSDILMEGNLNAKVAELEAQVSALQKSIKELTGPARKRRRED
ncbi:hypothetical protein ACHAPG_009094 [Botrytis cinerea]